MQIINDNGELKVKFTKREAKRCIAELEAHLDWFQTVAIPFYAQVFAPSNNACTRPASAVGTEGESDESAGG